MEQKMWIVISIYRAQIIPGREVTCNVSHPTFTHPQILTIVIPDLLVSVLAGSTGLLHCPHNPGDTLIMMTWWIHCLYKPPCLISVTTENRSFNNCSERIIRENLSLKILKTQITDTGKYSCGMVNAHGTFQTSFMLHVLVPPSVSLTINPAGFPECWAVSGIPDPEISWIPESDTVTTRKETAPDTTWTVISTYRAQIIPGREVTCNVSHPTFTHPQILTIVIPGMWVSIRTDSWLQISASDRIQKCPIRKDFRSVTKSFLCF
uniref:Ig-like domain-containing protein n=1 Tax=Leptobrachium leishanense TaxID=445787 RepID=A0A8C5QRA5_9ANUR